MSFSTRQLGTTSLEVGPLGLASSYGAPAEAFVEAFDKGCNYFVWNTFIRGRSKNMGDALRSLIKAGHRDKLVIALHVYAHNALLNYRSVKKSLKQLGTDYADVLLLGYYSWKPGAGVLHGAERMKKSGMVRHIGMTGHNRRVIGNLIEQDLLDVYHVRYNAVHTGAEKDIFPRIKPNNNPGIVAFTATSWGQLLDPKKIPPGETPLTAADCYRFALSNSHINVCLSGPKDLEQLRENLAVIEAGPLTPDEMARVRRIGEFAYTTKSKK